VAEKLKKNTQCGHKCEEQALQLEDEYEDDTDEGAERPQAVVPQSLHHLVIVQEIWFIPGNGDVLALLFLVLAFEESIVQLDQPLLILFPCLVKERV